MNYLQESGKTSRWRILLKLASKGSRGLLSRQGGVRAFQLWNFKSAHYKVVMSF